MAWLRFPHLLAAVALAGALACGSSRQTAATTPTPASPTSPTSPSGGGTPTTVPGCAITTSSDGLPMVSDPKSPYYDYLGVASTTDGLSASGFREALAHASAPDGSRLPDGTLGVYYNSGETGGIWMARLTGTTLTPVSAITVNNVLRPKWMSDVDVTLVNGKLRMIYLNGENGGRRFCIAESSDGLTFQTVALAIEFTGTEADPTVVQLNDGTWLMAFSRENHTGVGFARSADGLTFTQFATATYGVVPELTVAADGRPRLYVCAAGNVDSYTSPDAGLTWTRDGTVIRKTDTGRNIVCDPTLIRTDGLFVFKTTDA